MSYQALYRVWRPKTFDELMGQEMITTTLKSAVANNQLSHAYLFTGPRGTGKTSAAKILGKAVNCPNQIDGNPCNECDICLGIDSGQISDVIEIDAASNNGVEEIRNLRENVRYAPSTATYKVYIIDEVHMLTTGAFNALLKTLEEPPSQVIFILATTEPHKIPATIISRTQRYDFKRIDDDVIIRRLQQVLDSDDINYDNEALSIIARASYGGLRDALSLLDQALSYNTDQVSVASALEVTGSLDQLVFVDYIQQIYHQQSQSALETLRRQFKNGKQANRFVEELTLFIRDILLSIHTQKNYTLLSQEELEPLLKDTSIDSSFYYQLVDSLNRAGEQMRFSVQPETYLEVMTIQLASDISQKSNQTQLPMIDLEKLEDLSSQLNQLQNQVQAQQRVIDELKEGLHRKKKVSPINENNRHEDENDQPFQRIERGIPNTLTHYQIDLAAIYTVLNEATSEGIKELKDNWQIILNRLTPQQRVIFNRSEVLAAGNGYALIGFHHANYCATYQQDSHIQQLLVNQAEKTLEKKIEFVSIDQADWQTTRKNYIALRKQNNNKPIDVSSFQTDTVSSGDGENKNELKPPHTDNLSSEIKEDSSTTTQANQPGHTQEATNRVSDLTRQFTSSSQEIPLDETVQRAIDLFGEDIVKIHYE